MSFVQYLWLFIQVIIGFNLFFPATCFLLWILIKSKRPIIDAKSESDYAIIVTAYEQTHTIPPVVNSILNLKYQNFLIYVVCDKCDISNLHFSDDRVIILQPHEVLASNTKSHKFAFDNFKRNHDRITIIDSDNLVDKNYLTELDRAFDKGFIAVQGIRKAKNLDTNIARLDAARDIYYHFYDGEILFDLGSSATLSGSGMAFDRSTYANFLETTEVSGAGFDKALQAWLLRRNNRIAFAKKAEVYDEKTSKSEQLINQRSRWINTWFKYFSLGFGIILRGIRNLSLNQFLFGIVLLRPPLFIFLIFSFLALSVNILFGSYFVALIWIFGFILFICFFLVALIFNKADPRIYQSLRNIPTFVFYQISSLLRVRKANKISVATKHTFIEEKEDSDES
ncbi:glycosyltransferase [Pedobacter sp. PWIIR3]